MRTEILLDHETASDGGAYVVRALLRVHGDPPASAERTPLNLGIVLDRSGSMSGPPLEHAKDAAALLVRRLWPEDVVSVVAYDDEVQTIAELTVAGHVVTDNGGIERREIRLPIRASLADGPRVEPEVRREVLLQEAARAREEAYAAQRKGDFGLARDRLADAARRMAAFGVDDPELREETEDLEQMAALFDAHGVSEADAKYLYQRGYAASTSRAMASRAISRIRRKGEGRNPGTGQDAG